MTRSSNASGPRGVTSSLGAITTPIPCCFGRNGSRPDISPASADTPATQPESRNRADPMHAPEVRDNSDEIKLEIED